MSILIGNLSIRMACKVFLWVQYVHPLVFRCNDFHKTTRRTTTSDQKHICDDEGECLPDSVADDVNKMRLCEFNVCPFVYLACISNLSHVREILCWVAKQPFILRCTCKMTVGRKIFYDS